MRRTILLICGVRIRGQPMTTKPKRPPKRRNRKHLPRPQKDDFYREKLNAILIYLEDSTDDTSFYRHDFFLRLLACLV